MGAAVPKVEPQLIPLFKDQTEATVTLKNNGVLPWEWKAASGDGTVQVQPPSGVLPSGASTTVALKRLVTDRSLEVTITASGEYAGCFPPMSVYMAINCENGLYRDGPFGSDSCKECPI